MTGAEKVLRTLVAHGVDTCFANPGTTEMYLLAALEKVTEIRPVLGLFEGVASGAADGYARMTGKPALTLFHLGPGFANSIANLHNARRSGAPIINVIGDQATYHRQYDFGLTSDIESLASPVSKWVRYCSSPNEAASDAAEAYAAAMQAPTGGATLILPGDSSWNEASDTEARRSVETLTASTQTVKQIAKVLRRGEQAALLIKDLVITAEIAALCSQICSVTGARAYNDMFVARAERGAGRTDLPRLPYFPEQLTEELADLRHLILIGANEPVTFFAYPNTPSLVKPEGCQVHTLATAAEDRVLALQALADELGAKPEDTVVERPNVPELPADGILTAPGVNAVVAHFLPEGAIISEEAATSGPGLAELTAGAAPHDMMGLTGGAIGQGLPLALGAAVACPDRKVISLQADGSSMYTIQALWSMAREQSDVTVVLYSNRTYAILRVELMRAGIPNPSDRIASLVDLDNPELDFVSLARGMGVQADRATTVSEFASLFSSAMNERGPRLIEAVLGGPNFAEQLAAGG